MGAPRSTPRAAAGYPPRRRLSAAKVRVFRATLHATASKPTTHAKASVGSLPNASWRTTVWTTRARLPTNSSAAIGQSSRSESFDVGASDTSVVVTAGDANLLRGNGMSFPMT